jgi:hypothetical protein
MQKFKLNSHKPSLDKDNKRIIGIDVSPVTDEIQPLIIVVTKTCQWILFWAGLIQFTSS